MADKKDPAWQEVLAGALRGLTTDTVGAPVDILASAMNALGIPVGDKAVGGSKWFRDKLGQPVEDSGAATAGNLASAVLSPGKASLDLAQALPLLAGIFTGPKSLLWDKDAAQYLMAMQEHIDKMPPKEAKAASDRSSSS